MRVTIEVDVVDRYITHKEFFEVVKNQDNKTLFMSQFSLEWMPGFCEKINSIKSPLSLIGLLTILPEAVKDKEFLTNLAPAHFRVVVLLMGFLEDKQKLLSSKEAEEASKELNECPTIPATAVALSNPIIQKFELLLILAWENLLPNNFYENR